MAQLNFSQRFQRFTRIIEHAVGSPWAFIIAIGSVVIWAGFGPAFSYSDTWQLVCNTSTTIVSYLLLFIIQSTQTHDTAALQLKLDALIIAIREARNELVNVESQSTEEIERKRSEILDQAKE